MGQPKVATPDCCQDSSKSRLLSASRNLRKLRVLASFTLAVGILTATIGGAAVVLRIMYSGGPFGDVASRLPSIGLSGVICLMFGGAALAVAALLFARSAIYVHRVLQINNETEQTQITLRQNEDRYRMLVQLMSTFCGTADVSGGIDSIQKGWAQYTGQSWEQQRGYGWVDVIHPDDRERVLHLWEETLRLKCSTRVEYRLWHAPSQEYHFCESAALPLFKEDGTVREWISALRDIDDQVNRLAGSAQLAASHEWTTPAYSSSPNFRSVDPIEPPAASVGG